MDLQISFNINSFLAWVAWGLAIVGSLMAYWIDNLALANIALLFGGAGATLHVRGMLAGTERRERAAFDLGRESVRPIR